MYAIRSYYDRFEIGIHREHAAFTLLDGRIRILESVSGQGADNAAALRNPAGADIAQGPGDRSGGGRFAEDLV